MIERLKRAVGERRAVLFVGAGVSALLGLPSFSELVDHLAKDLGYDPEIYKTHGDAPALAEFYLLEKGRIGSLRSWMDQTWHQGVDLEKSEVHRLIFDLDFPIIYTTNYDSWLERTYDLYGRDYRKIVTVDDMAGVPPGSSQIVKFHGDMQDDNSIVLAESDYFDRLSFESPLDIRLRSDLLGRSVLFVGYSLADINLRYMLYKLAKQWRDSPFAGDAPNAFIYLARPNPVQEGILESRGVFPFVSESDDPAAGLRDFLSSLLPD